MRASLDDAEDGVGPGDRLERLDGGRRIDRDVRPRADCACQVRLDHRAALVRRHLIEREARTSSRLATHTGRAETARRRAETADDRDATAAGRDETANQRDVRAEAIDRSIALSDAPLAEKFKLLRARAAAERARAAHDRAEAARERARLEAELHSAHLDDLTGAFHREIGRLALTHEIDRAQRGDGRFMIAFVDVDGMKRVNDRVGHAAGDHVLRTLVLTMRSNLRSYDPIVRYGGDEFVCGLGGVDLEDVERRFHAIDRSVQDAVGVSVSVGLAALEAGETLDQLTTRADVALLLIKKGRGE